MKIGYKQEMETGPASVLCSVNGQVKEYAAGNKDKDTAIADFKSAVHDSYSYLKAE